MARLSILQQGLQAASSPVLLDTGASGYRDFGMAGLARPEEAQAASGAAPMQGEVLPPDPSQTSPDGYEAQFRQAYDQMIKAAEAQKRAAGNPLNVVGSVLGGVVGMPFKFLRNAIGGENNDLTAPFRPKQMAEANYQATIANLADKRAKFEENLAQIRSSRASALKTALTDQRKDQEEALARVAGLAAEVVRGDPQYQQQNWEAGLAELAQANPSIMPLARNWTQFNPALAGRLVGAYGNEGARKAWSDYTGVDATTIPENSAVILRPGNALSPTQVVTQGSQNVQGRGFTYGAESFPAVSLGNPTPAVAAPVDAAPAPMYEVPPANIPSGNPLDPNLANTPALSVDAIDAELRKRGVQF